MNLIISIKSPNGQEIPESQIPEKTVNQMIQEVLECVTEKVDFDADIEVKSC